MSHILLLTAFMVSLASGLTTLSEESYASVSDCNCQKGEKGSPGLITGIIKGIIKGAKGDPGIPGTCSNSCSSLPDVKICSEVALSLGREFPNSNGDNDIDSERVKRATSSSVGTLLNELKRGEISVSQLSTGEAESILAYCISSSLIGGNTGEKGDQGEVGEPGEHGIPGINGTKGEKGMKGDPGIANTGRKGDKGEKGCIGDQGPVGHTGLPGRAGSAGNSGVAFIRWGENWCPHSSNLLLKGLAFDFKSKHNELLCVNRLSKPSMIIGTGSNTHQLTPIAYPAFILFTRYLNCAHCHAPNKSAVFVQLGAEVCPSGWTTEYKGYAISTKTSDVVCLQDRVAKIVHWKSLRPKDIQLITVSCPSSVSACSGYLSTDSITCAVCTK